jgi:hypothetical protein
LLLEEASIGRVGTVAVQTLECFGSYEMLVHVLIAFERGAVDLVIANATEDEPVVDELQLHAPVRRGCLGLPVRPTTPAQESLVAGEVFGVAWPALSCRAVRK